MTTSITCRYANVTGAVGACGTFTADHHAEAAARGLCCVAYAFRKAEPAAALPTPAADGIDQAAPDAPDWPPFDPCDDDVPGVTW